MCQDRCDRLLSGRLPGGSGRLGIFSGQATSHRLPALAERNLKLPWPRYRCHDLPPVVRRSLQSLNSVKLIFSKGLMNTRLVLIGQDRTTLSNFRLTCPRSKSMTVHLGYSIIYSYNSLAISCGIMPNAAFSIQRGMSGEPDGSGKLGAVPVLIWCSAYNGHRKEDRSIHPKILRSARQP